MTHVIYVGGSKDGTRGMMPYGLRKLQAQSNNGTEIYIEKTIDLHGIGRIRVMALEGLHEEALARQLHQHYR